MDINDRFLAIVIAAGLSSRMGGFKPLMDVGGNPALLRLLDTIYSAGIVRAVVVTGHGSNEIEAALAGHRGRDQSVMNAEASSDANHESDMNAMTLFGVGQESGKNTVTPLGVDHERGMDAVTLFGSDHERGMDAVTPFGVGQESGKNTVTPLGVDHERGMDAVTPFGVDYESGLDVVTIFNADYKSGMFSSIQTGIRCAVGQQTVSAALLFPVDVPLVSVKTITGLIRAWEQGAPDGRPAPPFAVPVYQGRNGHPLLIPREYFGEILSYKGEGGLKGVRAGYDESMIRYETDDRGCVLDMDTAEDYRQVLEHLDSEKYGKR